VPRNRIPSPQTIKVLHALAAEPARWRYGYELGAQTGLKAGSLYPILVRLADRGLLDAEWEQTPPHGRPARHLYRLTAAGLELATFPAAVPVTVSAPASAAPTGPAVPAGPTGPTLPTGPAVPASEPARAPRGTQGRRLTRRPQPGGA
jgi:hypothetical protein